MPPDGDGGAGPVVDGSGVTFELADPYRRLGAVRLVQELGLSQPLDFVRSIRSWSLRLDSPGVDRMEYLLEIEDHNGHRQTVPDPGNPLRAAGAFGDKSVIEFHRYRRPDWLEAPGVSEHVEAIAVDCAALDGTVGGAIWWPEGLPNTAAAPLLVVNDGTEFAQLGGFTRYLSACVAAGTLPPLRALLLAPSDRNLWYSANPAYATALCAEVLPALPVATTIRVGVGVSLGGLAMLHAHRCFPTVFDGLLLQSGSFFTPGLDPQESGFSGFAAVTGFVAEVSRPAPDRHPVPAVFTCGVLEENLANNRAMAAALGRNGYPTEFVEVRDAHNFTAWRDALHPQLTRLVTTLDGARAA